MGRHLRGRRVRDAGRRRDLGDPQQGRPGGLQPREPYPEFGQCVHKLVIAADGDERLYQQNHCGVYRSTDGAATWDEITPGLPSQFGFVMTAHPRDPLTVWNIPLTEPEQGRLMPDNAAAVWRTTDGGDTWSRFGDGLPQRDAFVGVYSRGDGPRRPRARRRLLRHEHGPALRSADEGRSWAKVADNLPPIWSVEAHVVG